MIKKHLIKNKIIPLRYLPIMKNRCFSTNIFNKITNIFNNSTIKEIKQESVLKFESNSNILYNEFCPYSPKEFQFIYNPEWHGLFYTLKKNNNLETIKFFEFNSLADFKAFWDIMCSLEFYKYSKNRLPKFNRNLLQRNEDISSLISESFDETDSTKKEIRAEIRILNNNINFAVPMLFQSPTSIKDIIDIFLIPFDDSLREYLSNSLNFSKEDKIEDIQAYITDEYLKTFIGYEGSRLKTIFNLPTYYFYQYMIERTYLWQFSESLYFRQPYLTNINFSLFFPYKEDIIDLIECFKKTYKAFLNNEKYLIEREIKLDPIISKMILDKYYDNLIKQLSLLSFELPSINTLIIK